MPTENRLSILLIDSEEEGHTMVRDLLAEANEAQFILDWATTYKAGLKTIASNQHDACLVAYHLGEHDGVSFVREAIGQGCQIPLILLTNQASREIERSAREAGTLDCLAKEQLGLPLLERSIRYAIERQQVEAALQETNKQLEATLNALPDLVFEVDHYGRIYDFRAPHPELLYASPQEFLGRTIDEILPEEVATIVTDALNQATRAGRHSGTIYSLETPAGTRWFELSIATKGDLEKASNRLIVLAHDFTERKQAEEDLRKARDELEQRVAERTVALTNANLQLREEILGRQRLERQTQEFLERRTRQVKTSTEIAQDIATTPNLEDLFRRVVNLVQKQFGYYHVHVYTLENDDLVMQEGTGQVGQRMKQAGHKISLMVEKSLVAHAARSGEPILAPDVFQTPSWLPNPLLPDTRSEIATPIKLRNEVLGVLDVQNDTVGSLGQEDQILLMGLCGQIAVAIDTRRLDLKRRQAEESQQKLIEDLDAFAHSVGFNLREPLALIVGYAELLKEQARLTEELQGFLNAIARNGHKLATIIDELQLLTGVRKAEVEIKPLNMARIVAEVQQRLAYLTQEYQAKITISEYWPVALGHKPWVEEVLTNYLSNAIRYGGEPPRVQIGATAQSDGMVRFWVRDNGPGLTSEEKAQLFTEFTDFNQAHIKGYGLGLSIVRRIITKLGGEVRVESDGVPGRGCIFSFTLPLHQG